MLLERLGIKMDFHKNIPQQTHFLGVLIPEDLTLTLEDFPVDNITIFERKGGKWVAAWSGKL